MTATIRTMTQLADDVEEVNTANGWFEDDRTFGDDLALLHSEVSEALEAYRSWGSSDVTGAACSQEHGHAQTEPHVCKPEGLGSELADVLVRLLDTFTRRDHLDRPEWWHQRLGDIEPAYTHGATIGDQLAHLHKLIAQGHLAAVAPYVVGLARFYRLDIVAEFDRKLAHNRSRGHRHGGKRL